MTSKNKSNSKTDKAAKTDKTIKPLKRPKKDIFYFHPITGNRVRQQDLDLAVLKALLPPDKYQKELQYREHEKEQYQIIKYIHPVNGNFYSLHTLPLKHLQTQVPADIYEAEKQRRKREQANRKKIEQEKKANKPKKQAYKKTNYLVKRAVGDFFVVVDMKELDLTPTKQEREQLIKQLNTGDYLEIEKANRRLMASIFGESVVFVTSDLELAEDIAYKGKPMPDLTEFHGFASKEDQDRARKLIIKAGL